MRHRCNSATVGRVSAIAQSTPPAGVSSSAGPVSSIGAVSGTRNAAAHPPSRCARSTGVARANSSHVQNMSATPHAICGSPISHASAARPRGDDKGVDTDMGFTIAAVRCTRAGKHSERPDHQVGPLCAGFSKGQVPTTLPHARSLVHTQSCSPPVLQERSDQRTVL